MEFAPVEVSVPGSPMRVFPPAAMDELTEHARTLLEANGGWTFGVEVPWAYARPDGLEMPAQGWKLHISATEASAPEVLDAVVPVLIAEGAAFKFAATKALVRILNSSTAARASGGKFLTIYPADDEQAVRVAEACHQATAGLTGPVILSDRPYRPGSLVHYRYGGFSDQHAIDADGMVVHLIRTPDGQNVPDERKAAYQAPAWAADPFQPPVPATELPQAPAPQSSPVLLNGRYLVRAALRHANKGGTYLAEDIANGVHVVIKEGRPHVGGSVESGGDARDRVRHEARMLEMASPIGLTPALVEVFEQGGHVFLVEEHIPASTLREMVADRTDPPEPGLPPLEVAVLAALLAQTMASFHAAGIVLRDFNPNNVLTGNDHELVLVDLELAHPLGEDPGAPAGTPGYASPEQLRGQPTGLTDDYWSLGATIAYVATGADPYLPADVTQTWSDPARLECWVASHLADGQMEPSVAAAILGCMAARPEERLAPKDVLAILRGKRRPPVRRARPAAGTTTRPDPAMVATGAVEWLLRSIGTGTSGHLWPAGPTGLPLDPANVQSGASGVGLFLAQAAPVLREVDGMGGVNGMGRRIDTALAAAAAWVSDRIARGPQRPPGLYFGTAGVAWFLTEAATVLDRPEIARRANELALSLPVRVPNPDLSHGTAGVGLGQLHQWRRTGDDRFLARAMLSAEHIVQTARRAAGEPITWTVPESAPTRLAGTTTYGFAHGTAGIATFLLYAGAATGEAAFTELGAAALASLLPHAVEVDTAAYWPVGPDNDELWPHWCNGSSGIGTAMLRAHLATGEDVFRRAAEAAARAGFRERWRHGPVQCHGLAGDSELVLDLATLGGDADSRDRHRARAADQADALWLMRRHDARGRGRPDEPASPDKTGPDKIGTAVFADDTGTGVSAGFGTGLAGIGSFFLRLSTALQGGYSPRPLLLDELLSARG